jgi:hypothetical protein
MNFRNNSYFLQREFIEDKSSARLFLHHIIHSSNNQFNDRMHFINKPVAAHYFFIKKGNLEISFTDFI